MAKTALIATIALCLSGCTALPNRSGCVAGEASYSPLVRIPAGRIATSNCWGGPDNPPCPGYRANVTITADGTISATCEPKYHAN